MEENEISKEVLDLAVKVHKALGPSLLRQVYELVLRKELETGLSQSRDKSPFRSRREVRFLKKAILHDSKSLRLCASA